MLQGLIGKAAEVQGYLPLPASLLKTSKAPGSGMARDGWPFQVQGLLIKAVIILAPLRLDYGTKSRG